jgi:L-rhamnonate dehydratase
MRQQHVRAGIGRRGLLTGALAGGAALPFVAGSGPAAAQTAAQGTQPRDPIVRVTATAISTPVVYPYGRARVPSREACCHVEVETASGLIGHGITGIAPDMRAIAAIVNLTIAPAIIGEDALSHEAIWRKLYWLLTPRGQSGFAVHAMSAVDIALWDIKGKTFNMPIARLLGGARERAPLYTTFGSHFLDRDQLVDAGRDLYGRGFTHLKIVVGSAALRGRDTTPLQDRLREDVARIAAVRNALGDGASLYIDANCNLDYPSARWMIEAIRPYNITFFEEPLRENDAELMAELRRNTNMLLAAGQNEGRASRFRDLLVAGAIDYAQPNVMNGGGFTQALRIAGMAEAFNVSIANGGAAGAHNVHLHAGLAHGGRVEWHATFMEMCKLIYRGIEDPSEGYYTFADRPGLGFEPDADAIREFTQPQ